MFDRKTISSFLSYSLSEEKWQEIENLEDGNELIKPRYNILGKHYNKLTVIGRAPNGIINTTGKKVGQWWCICDCSAHNIVLVRHNNLTSNNTKSCGCQNDSSRKENVKKAQKASTLDLTNKKFFELTALAPTNERKNNSVVWKCKCSCGKIYYAAANELSADRIKSCGHLNESKGVYKIKKILEENDIQYITEKVFKDCRFPDTNACARFDFYVDNKFLIEYDGEQHFKEKDLNYFKDSLEKRKEHDRFKSEWCKKNNIPLIRFSYKELDLISLDEIQKRLNKF